MVFSEKSKKFDITYNSMTLEFEFYTKEFIQKKLEELKEDKKISSFRCVNIPDKRTRFSEIKKEYTDEQGNEKYHFFSYIKFFEYDEKEYGLVGGKTNYPSPDIAFDYLKKRDNRIARKFLKDNKLKWSRKVIIVNHAPFLERKKDERQALFLESFLQRKFNLFDS